MDNISGSKMFNHLDRIVGEHRPITADVFLTNYCNNKCPYCTYGRWKMDSGAYAMKCEDFAKYAERMIKLGVEGIILTGGGEPTLCPDFMRITAWLEEKGVHYGVNTNFNNLKLIKPDFLKVSLDGWDEDSYEVSRGVRKYQQAANNIKEYCAWRRENSPKTSVGVQRVCSSEGDVYRFYEKNKDLDVDYFSFRPIESVGGQYYLEEDKQIEAERIKKAVGELAKSDSRVILNYKWQYLNTAEKECSAQWAQLAINEKGEVMYCCHKPYQIVGHIMDYGILEKKAQAKTDMAMCDVPCRLTAPNKFVAEAMAIRKDPYFI